MKQSKRTRSIAGWTICLTVLIGNLTETAFALWNDNPIQLNRLQEQNVSVSGFPAGKQSDGANNKANAFSLTGFGTIDFSSAVKSYIRDSLTSPFLNIRQVNTGLSLTNQQNSTVESAEFQLAVGTIPLCNSYIKAHMLWNGRSIVLGKVPQLDVSPPPSNDDWPRLDLAIAATQEHLEETGIVVETTQINRSQQCYAQRGNSLVRAWDIIMVANGFGYHSIADGYEVLKFENMFFDATGKVKAYDSNPLSGVIKTYEMELEGDTHLTSQYFTTITKPQERAQNADNKFEYEPGNPKFEEASAFAHGALMLEYFRSLGYAWHGPKPLTINLHVGVNSSQNNALYQPAEASGTKFPEITIGDGDGNILRNLPVDSDVISHEFGHHIIYQTLTSVSGQSLIIHEGLADYFTFSRTNDACLGESICPPDSLACWIKGACLRSAENDIKYGTASFTKLEAHLQGQLVSGYLWDLHTKDDIPFADVTKILYTGISYFTKDSGLRDLVLALMLADNTETDGKYCDKIMAGAAARGLDTLLADLSCDKDANTWGRPSGVVNTPTPGSTPPPSKRTTSGNGPFGCGIVGTQNMENLGILLILFITFPFFFPNYQTIRGSLGKKPIRPSDQS
jgi:hypothetical protein